MGRFERGLGSAIKFLLAIVTSVAFLVPPAILVYMVFIKVTEKGKDLVIASVILLILTTIYNIIVLSSTRKIIAFEKSGLERIMGICLRIGGFLFALGLILTVFMLLVGLLEFAVKEINVLLQK